MNKRVMRDLTLLRRESGWDTAYYVVGDHADASDQRSFYIYIRGPPGKRGYAPFKPRIGCSPTQIVCCMSAMSCVVRFVRNEVPYGVCKGACPLTRYAISIWYLQVLHKCCGRGLPA